MAEARNRKLVRRLLKKIRKDDRTIAVPVARDSNAEYMRAYRHSLKGSTEERTTCIKKLNDYLVLLKIAPESKLPIPTSLHPLVAELRKVAGSIRLTCTARMEAIEKLLFLEGVTVPQTGDAQWQLIHRELGTAAPLKEISPNREDYRVINRKQALVDIVECFRADREAGLIETLNDVARGLRLPEMEPIAKPAASLPAEVHKDEVNRVLNMF